MRLSTERQLAAVVGFLEDSEFDEFLTLAVERFVAPADAPDGVDVPPVDVRLVSSGMWTPGD